jgi:hypothetical protein
MDRFLPVLQRNARDTRQPGNAESPELFAKSPMQMRREAAGGRSSPAAVSPGRVDPSQRPRQAAESGCEFEAAIDWLAQMCRHVQAGRIGVE